VDAGAAFKDLGVDVQSIETDLSSVQGVRQLLDALGGRQVDVLVANAGHGLGHAFLDQTVEDWKHVIETNITGTLLLIQPIVKQMVARNEGKVLITGSIAGHIAGSFQAVYNGSKAFVDSFAAALENELKDTNVTVTCLKPGATETEFFHRAGLDDTKVGQSKKDDPADVAKTGWEAMKDGAHSVVHGMKNKAQVLASGVLSEATTAEMHRKQAEPGSGEG
jgi:short-subunit dehydrogenase